MRLKEKFDGTKLKFMSDLHYNHSNILWMNGRPYKTIEEMNRAILGTLEHSIGPGDILFDLGDLFWRCPNDMMDDFLSRVKPGRFYKILGNHDKQNTYTKDPSVIEKFTGGIYDLLEIKVDYEGKEYYLVLSHYPLISWNHKPRGSFNLFGHCHGHIDSYINSRPDLQVDIGFDGNLAKSSGNFILDFPTIVKYMKDKSGGTDFSEYAKSNCKEL